MTYRANDSWNQHLDEMNRRRVFQPLTVELVRIEGHVRTGWKHIEHVHPYWQMEVVEAGGFSLRIERTRLYPKKGDIIFIPRRPPIIFTIRAASGAGRSSFRWRR